MYKKIINSPDNVVEEMLEGFVAAHRNMVEPVPGASGVRYLKRRQGKVTLVVGGGSGHEPMFAGFVGRGLADAAACGNVFASPDPGTICAVAAAAHGGCGVLFLYGNYAGDNLNFDMAEEMLAEEGTRTAHVRVKDDCASAPTDRSSDRRGIAGDLFAIKIAGAACDAGLPLEGVRAVTERALEGLRSIGLATAPGQVPGAEAPTFSLNADEIEYGLGIHGEPGSQRSKLAAADTLTDRLYEELTADMPLSQGDRVCVLINGLGATPAMELYIVYRRVLKRLTDAGVQVHDAAVGNYCTSMEMGGFSVSLFKLDAEIAALYDAPCHSPYFTRGAD
jgi:dihydroxyacetone kinase